MELVGGLKYGLVITGVALVFCLFGLVGSGDTCLISYMTVFGVFVCPGCFFNMTSHIVQSVACGQAFATLLGYNLLRMFGYHMMFQGLFGP